MSGETTQHGSTHRKRSIASTIFQTKGGFSTVKSSAHESEKANSEVLASEAKLGFRVEQVGPKLTMDIHKASKFKDL